MTYKMKGHTLPGINQRKTDPDAPGTPGTPGYEPPVTSMDYLTKTPSIVATDLRKKEYNQSEAEQEKESDEETEKINTIPNTKPTLFPSADAHRKTKSNLAKKKMNKGVSKEKMKALDKLLKK